MERIAAIKGGETTIRAQWTSIAAISVAAAQACQLLDVTQRTVASVISTLVQGRQTNQSALHATAWSPDSRFLALAFADNSVRLWDVKESRSCEPVFRDHFASNIRSLEFAPEFRNGWCSGEHSIWTVRVWSLETLGSDSRTDSVGIRLVPLPAADFVMGLYPGPQLRKWLGRATGNTLSIREREQPQHWVRISRPFYLGQHEVTVKQFRTFVEATNYKTTAESNGLGGKHLDAGVRKGRSRNWASKPEYTWRTPGFAQTDEHPVVQVSWDDAQAFCRWLSEREGAVYRLPTEAEWEYACRAGQEANVFNARTKGLYATDEESKGNFADQSLRREFGQYDAAGGHDVGFPWTAPVGRFNLNDFGLYDMQGNVFEWCSDWFDPDYYSVAPASDPPGPPSGTERVGVAGCFRE